jgi:hypothetical protein
MLMKTQLSGQCITPSQVELTYNVRLILKRLLIWTRLYFVNSFTGTGTAETLFSRLLQENSGFADLILPFFGRRDSERNAQLLNQFAYTFRDLITTMLSGNNNAVNDIVNRLYQNNSDRAAFLASINPYLNETVWKNYLDTYLQYLLEEVNAYTSGDYNRDIELFDKLNNLTNNMGDYFAQSLYTYITSGSQTSQGNQPCITYEQLNEIFTVRTVLFNLAVWVRNFMLSKFQGTGDVNAVHARLQQIPVEYVNALKQIFGDNPALSNLQAQLVAYVDLIDSLTTAQIQGRTDEIQRITQLLYQNANDIAASLASLNPTYWDQNVLKSALSNTVGKTISETILFQTNNYASTLEIFSSILDEAEDFSEYISKGLINYINSRPK